MDGYLFFKTLSLVSVSYAKKNWANNTLSRGLVLERGEVIRSTRIALKPEKHPVGGSHVDRSTASHTLYGKIVGTWSLRNIAGPTRNNIIKEKVGSVTLTKKRPSPVKGPSVR